MCAREGKSHGTDSRFANSCVKTASGDWDFHIFPAFHPMANGANTLIIFEFVPLARKPTSVHLLQEMTSLGNQWPQERTINSQSSLLGQSFHTQPLDPRKSDETGAQGMSWRRCFTNWIPLTFRVGWLGFLFSRQLHSQSGKRTWDESYSALDSTWGVGSKNKTLNRVLSLPWCQNHSHSVDMKRSLGKSLLLQGITIPLKPFCMLD